ncbi:hypothetical protein BDR06DRAFT_1002854 [Suillus hirtellus]|nr:hypothetical protein BDR06DRAFT_1002854 [Suillus hirtellus]
MLEAAKLPTNLWGEAALTVCYLWNRSTSCTLPPNVTPFKLVNSRKPNLSYIQVFRSRCFARIPTELQVKLGPHSQPAIFLRYTEGTKEYCLCDQVTSTFFVTCNIIFDEHLPSVPYLKDDSDSDDALPLTPSSIPHAVPSSPQVTAAPKSPVIVSTIRHPTQSKVSTAGGQAWEAEMNATKACLQTLHESHATCAQAPVPSNEGVVAEEEEVYEKVNLEEIELNIDVPEVFANVMIKEHVHISI